MNFGGLNLGDMMGKVQEAQEAMHRVRERLNELTVDAEAGGGMVRVRATASKRVLKVEVDPDLYSDKEMMEDLICAAVNKAIEKADELSREEMARATKGLLPNFPGLDLKQMGL